MPKPARRDERPRILVALAACLLLGACASAPPDSVTQTQDPWEKFNRSMYSFNDKLDKTVARPVAGAYNRAMPAPTRSGLHNVISNLGEPVTVINDLLQGKVKQSLQDAGRFILNSTVGLLGWFDPAKHIGLVKHDEDLGQTLAVWGVPSGPYLVLPVLGPSTVRDTGGMGGDVYLNPVKQDMQARYRNDATLLYGLDTRAGLMQANDAIDSAFDPYTFVRDAYLQNRRFKIYDGNPPSDESLYDLPPDEGTSSPPTAASAAAPAAVSSKAPSSATTATPATATVAPPPG